MKTTLLDAHNSFSAIRNLIKEAGESVDLICPYWDLGSSSLIKKAIHGAVRRKVRVRAIFREDAKNAHETLAELAALGVQVFYAPRLHAKVFRSEKMALVGSLNMTEVSRDSVELMMQIADAEQVQEIGSFMERELKDDLRPLSTKRASVKTRTRAAGHCIRCRDDIELNAERPYCAEDFKAWNKWADKDYEDKFCHGCGKKHPATMRRPVCERCYRAA